MLYNLLADMRLEVAYDSGEGVRAHAAAQQVMRVGDALSPFAHAFAHGVFQRAGARIDAVYLGAHELHAVHVKSLTLHVFHSHVHMTFHAHKRCHRGSRHAMLTGAGFRDEARLAYALGEQRLAERIVYLMCARVVQILALQVYFRAVEIFGHALGEIQQARSVGVIVEKRAQLGFEGGVVFVAVVRLFQLYYGVHQGFGNVLPAVSAESRSWVRHGGPLSSARPDGLPYADLVAFTACRILPASFIPAVSRPLLRSSA